MSYNFKMPTKLNSATEDNSLTKSEQVVGVVPSLSNSIKVSSIKPIASVNSLKPIDKPVAKPTSTTVVKPVVKPLTESSPVADSIDISDSALALIADAPVSYKESLHEVVDLDELAREFQNSEQPDKFDDSATEAVHKAVLSLEKSIDNADEVRTQLTFIMTELQKYPNIAAKICDSDIHIMVRALRQSYNTVAFTKKINKSKSESAKNRAMENTKDLLSSDLFEGLGI